MPHRTSPGIPMQAGKAPVLGDRYTNIPNAVHALADTPREFQLIAALLSYRWYPDSPIMPSVETLARQLDCSHRTIRRTAAALEARGLIRREERRTDDRRQVSNFYHLAGALLAAVTRMEASGDRPVGQPWQGRRSPLAGERNSQNSPNGTTASQKPRAVTQRDFYATREGRLRGY